MNITISSIGKFKNNPQKVIFDSYLKRIPWNLSLKELEVKGITAQSVLKTKEGESLLKSIPDNSTIISLDEKGRQFSSLEFANLISELQNQGTKNLFFIIGGANGISDQVRKESRSLLSLGKMTFPHMMARSILAEQLYRAYSILNNHPYHRE